MIEKRPISDWLPMSLKEAKKRSWDKFDVILVSGDAYVDHTLHERRAASVNGEGCALRSLASALR